ncbi:MAG: hypothetical protein NTZ72_18125, partial [Afipia sp.]|nr:hypothetical protein [Afipia sp.]
MGVRSPQAAIGRSVCVLLSFLHYLREQSGSRVGQMIIKKLLQTRKADVELSTEIRAALIESLFAPVSSLVVGAVGCAIVGALVASRVGNHWIMATSIAIFTVGMSRVASTLLYRKYKKNNNPTATKL